MLEDFHLHTLISDGELTPTVLLAHAARHGVRRAAITDHDSLGAYRWEEGAVFSEARRLGVELTVGIEMDADWDGVEVHVLGLDVSLDDGRLNHHLTRVRETRRERARREIDVVCGLLGAGAVREADVFVPGRETLMKPHFIRPLLARGFFASYELANAWYHANVKTGIEVPRPDVGEAVRIIHEAGGWASLAHAGYYERDGLAGVLERLPDLVAEGLDAVELEYPYHACSPHLFGLEDERRFLAALRAAAASLGLRFTRGSDAHAATDFERSYGAGFASVSAR
ncbi:MAG: PHP domain-containing protein [Vicinamibacteria bacterium]